MILAQCKIYGVYALKQLTEWVRHCQNLKVFHFRKMITNEMWIKTLNEIRSPESVVGGRVQARCSQGKVMCEMDFIMSLFYPSGC